MSTGHFQKNSPWGPARRKEGSRELYSGGLWTTSGSKCQRGVSSHGKHFQKKGLKWDRDKIGLHSRAAWTCTEYGTGGP